VVGELNIQANESTKAKKTAEGAGQRANTGTSEARVVKDDVLNKGKPNP
jgi:hypothetical protein